ELANTGGRHRSHAVATQTSTTNRLCSRRHRVDGSARKRAHTYPSTFSLGVRDAAMSLETSRHVVQLELSRAWLVQFAQHLVFSDHSRGGPADGGLVFARGTVLW